MDLFIYSDFCRPDIIDAFKKLCPNVNVIQSDPLYDKHVSADLSKVYRTNAKLLFEKAQFECFKLGEILEALKSVGFIVRSEHQFVMYKEQRTILVPNEKYMPEYRKCECGKTDIQLPQPMEKKIITVKVKHHFDDRVILEVEE